MPATRYPQLYAPQRWEWGGIDAVFSTDPPPDDLVSNVHVVGFVGERIVVCRVHRDGRDVWFLPGGTREPNESIHACAIRELREEAGARLDGPFHWIGAHHTITDSPKPHRPHQPHPEKYWLWCYADVILDSAPTNPAGDEATLEVAVVEPSEAKRLLLTDGAWMPDLVSLAQELRSAR